MTAWIAIAVIGAASYALRLVSLEVGTRTLRPGLESALALAAPAAVAAVLATMTLTAGGTARPLPAAELIAIAAGFAGVRRTGNTLYAFAAGLPALWIATALGI